MTQEIIQNDTQENTQEIRGTLLLKAVDLGTPETGFIHDWYIQPYPDFKGKRIDEIQNIREIDRPEPILLEKGDLLNVFNTVSKADVIFERILERAYTAPQPTGKGEASLTMTQWGYMFMREFPASLEKVVENDAHTFQEKLFGRLTTYQDFGPVETIFHHYDRPDIHGIAGLNSGDRLVVYNDVREGNILLSEKLDFNDHGPFYDRDKFGYNRLPISQNKTSLMNAFFSGMPAIMHRKLTP